MVFRIVAAETFSDMLRVSVRDPTGSPELRYPSTTRRNTSRERSFISARSFVPFDMFAWTLSNSTVFKCRRASIGVASGDATGLSGQNLRKGSRMRPSGRKLDEMRPISIEIDVMRHAEGSCLIKVGDTHVLCSATIEDKAPSFLKNSGLGWVTAEYGMLPRATNSRTRREAAAGKQSGRTQEIQRLIGRALRAGVDRSALGERQIVVDCDVIQADGGTRCASITGGWVALRLAMNKLLASGAIVSDPIIDNVAAVSCGIFAGQPVLDLDYPEDSAAGTDGNFVLTGRGRMIEVQMSAEGATFSRAEMGELLDLAEQGAGALVAAQKAVLGL